MVGECDVVALGEVFGDWPWVQQVDADFGVLAFGGAGSTDAGRCRHDGRRRDLAILHAIGADRSQRRAIFHWHACMVAGLGLAIGLPAGLAAGRRVNETIADSAGVVPTVRLPVAVVLAMITGVVVIANLVAITPARRAARLPTAQVLHQG